MTEASEPFDHQKPITMSESNLITCPACSHEFAVEAAIAQRTEQRLRHEFEQRAATDRKRLDEEASKLQSEREQLAEQKRQETAMFAERLEQRLKEERTALERQIGSRLAEEQGQRLALMEKELKEKSEQVRELHRAKAEIEAVKREKEELGEKLKAEAAKEMNERIAVEKERIRKEANDSHEMRLREMQKQLDDQKKLTEEMKRKQEQGSMQLQGEVQELAIEEWLRRQFPLDTVDSIKQGVRGADCIQTVNTLQRPGCGTIYYESKRTKDFNRGWIEKFRNDMRERGADVGVLVTEAMPSQLERMGQIDGVWICTFDEFKGLSVVLRDSVVRVSEAVGSQENKGEKMQMLYDYLTGSSFRMQVEAIVEGFSAMKEGLAKEKRVSMRLWSEREKQIDKVIENTVGMYGSVRGIAGSAVQEVKALELPEADDADDDMV